MSLPKPDICHEDNIKFVFSPNVTQHLTPALLIHVELPTDTITHHNEPEQRTAANNAV